MHVRNTADLKINVIKFYLIYMIFQNVDRVLATATLKNKHSNIKVLLPHNLLILWEKILSNKAKTFLERFNTKNVWFVY